MSQIENTVFISYRRTNEAWARAISQNLAQHLYDVFLDYTGIGSGAFERVIVENIRSRAHFLIVLTPSALDRTGDRDDWLRREIETALDNRRNIVPITLEGFDFYAPSIAEHLTGTLAPLKLYNALEVPRGYFDAAMDRLRGTYLNVPLDAVLHPISDLASQAARDQQAAAAMAPAVQERELSAEEWFERGNHATIADEKLRCYTEAIRLKSDYAEAYLRRADTHKVEGDLHGADKDYREAADAYNQRAVARKAKGDDGGALSDFRDADFLEGRGGYFYAGESRYYRNRGDLQRAEAECNYAIHVEPACAEAYYERGNIRTASTTLSG